MKQPTSRRKEPARGTKASYSKLTEDAVREIRKRCTAGEMQRLVAEEFGVSQTAVSGIMLRKHWAWLD